jgi:hypothetical protein
VKLGYTINKKAKKNMRARLVPKIEEEKLGWRKFRDI